jgi:hypothetical protein
MKPNSLKIILGSFQILSKNRGDIHKSSCNTSINNTSGKLPLVSTTLTAVSINKHRCQIFPPESLVSLILVAMSKIPAKNFVAGVNVTGGKLPLVSMTPAAN